ncbi:hypothetical protein D9758_016013 [Tetrapyrgos nigripes]|uniref:Uncharacterized protein n=1 Tax=Tetrapyrgos nigripes TaxID=182062 RepID=A0A8H5CLZ3_9AGAR|nr:hypothetical protein D9758_016013 [Tetrapyrgos nigripes]
MVSFTKDLLMACVTLSSLAYAYTRQLISHVLEIFAPIGFFDIAVLSLVASLCASGGLFLVVRWFISVWRLHATTSFTHNQGFDVDLECQSTSFPASAGLGPVLRSVGQAPSLGGNESHHSHYHHHRSVSKHTSAIVMLPVLVQKEDLVLEEGDFRSDSGCMLVRPSHNDY